MSGLFDVMGMMDDTVLRKMVRDSKIVTPETREKIYNLVALLFSH